MKAIQPISIWQNGQTKQATILDAYVIQDNLTSYASFYYSIMSDNKTQLAAGNLTMTGRDYDSYETNQNAWDWIGTQLNLTITGDYIPPVSSPEVPTPSPEIPVSSPEV
jgi:hypothetical protein